MDITDILIGILIAIEILILAYVVMTTYFNSE